MAERSVRQPVNRGRVRVPVVMQMEARECGAACLCMILAYYGRWIPLEQARTDCGVSRDGIRAGDIVRAARGYGFTADGYRFGSEELREHGSFPCVLHWESNHFVVCRGFRGDRAYLIDPAQGEITVSMAEFRRGFSGVCLVFEPGASFAPGGSRRSVAAFTRKRLSGVKRALAVVLIATAVGGLAGILHMNLSRVFLDDLLTGRNPEGLRPFLAGMGILSLVLLAVEWIQTAYFLRLEGRAASGGAFEYMRKILRLPMTFFFQRKAGDLQQRKDACADIAGKVMSVLAPLVLNTGLIVFYLAVMLRYSLLLSLVGLASVLLQLAVAALVSRRRLNLARVMAQDSGKLAAATITGLEMMETLRACGGESGFFETWAGLQASVNTQNVLALRLNRSLELLAGVLSATTDVAVLALGVWLTMRGQFTAGMIFAFQGFLSAFLSPARQLISSGRQVQEIRTGMERIEDVTEAPEDGAFSAEDAEAGGRKLSGGLVLRNVAFGYSPADAPAVDSISLEIKPGQWVALVGPSGCGKSTLACLIAGLYRPLGGEILMDGRPAASVGRGVLMRSVAMAEQDPVLFEDTVAANIRMWDESIGEDALVRAARDAWILDDILRFEDGWDHRIAEGGRDLSGGQRQRLEIARALVRDPSLLILDEATSALDAETEAQVMAAIRARKIACVVIAHRLAAVRDCDEILVISGGKVVERGTHEQLQALNGVYSALIMNE